MRIAMFSIVMAATITALAAVVNAASPLPVGERLHYRGYLFGWLPVGDAWFEVGRDTYEGESVYRIDARALGDYLLYTLDIRLSSLIDPARMQSVVYHRRQAGSEKREYDVVFDRKRDIAVYRRKQGEFQSVEEMDAAPWVVRRRFPAGKKAQDILATLYFARDIGSEIGEKRICHLVEKDFVWKTRVTVTGEQRLDLGRAGSFNALKIAIEPDFQSQPETGEKFAGLFGVEGSLEVWVEKERKIPLLVRGRLPFVPLFKPSVTVALKDYEFTPEAPRDR